MSNSPLKTYLVEDSPVIRESLIATLEDLVSLKVVGTADTEEDAIAWLSKKSNGCDLVIIDIFLKRGSGLGVLGAVKAMARHHALVILSNFATADLRRKCTQLGADKVFDKSNEIDSLVEYCQGLANNKSGNTLPLGL